MHRQRALSLSEAWPAAAAAAAAAVLVTGALAIRPSTPALLIAAIAAVALAPLVVRIIQGRFDPFEPIFVFTLAWGGMFVVRPLAMLHYNEFSYIWAGGIPMRQGFERMLVLALLGGLAFVLGYALPLGKRLANRAPAAPTGARTSTVTFFALCFAALGLACFALFVWQSGTGAMEIIFSGRSLDQYALLGRANKYFVLGPVMLVAAGAILFAMGMDRRSAKLVVLSFSVLGLTWLIWNSMGSRIVLFPMFAALGLLYYLHHDRRPRAITVVALLVFAVFASAVMGAQRTATTRKEEGLLTVAARIAANPDEATEPLLRGSDNAMAPGLATAVTVVPSQQGYSYGWSFVRDMVVRPIPRSLWEGKPLSPRQELIKRMNPKGFHEKTANPEFSNLLLPYLNWGLFGAGLLVLYGVAARFAFEWFRLHRKEVSAQLMYAFAVPLCFPLLRDNAVDAAVLAGLMVVPIWLTFRLGRLRLSG